MPPVMWPTVGRRFMMERPVVDLPQPDSPTSPTHSPSRTENETSSTAFTVDGAEVELGMEVFHLDHRPSPRNGAGSRPDIARS